MQVLYGRAIPGPSGEDLGTLSPPSRAKDGPRTACRLRYARTYQMGVWWNGRHDGLKIHWPQGREGSSPSAPTPLWAQTPWSEAC